ncbi:ubiquitin-associated domain-containing family protein [Striga asiatica]|uniref:Ubiquitin-associated domain-containing family protein n=1 Tax=Striga asiatica TaxID=4170 RepID=A0A5A7Q6T9_STRAF|nr:ubiquitin-associated domain-containing family protein [Striga asiatica]
MGLSLSPLTANSASSIFFSDLLSKVEAMSPASRSKSKDKKATSKETAKVSSKPLGPANTSGYNPLSGTFHTFDTAPVPSVSPLHINGRFRTIDDSDDQNGNSSGTGAEYDSVSNNGSWSGESEDHKEKASQAQNSRQESIPGADNDKREKIRLKNERKHQRQKERRAQELHERCSGYLMSRKLEALAQQLVSMGFSHERATMALIQNEGRVEESVAWLFEVAEDEKQLGSDLSGSGGGNLKIDISEELAWITDMEIRYKASKQEVERAVVSCEGDLHKAEEILKAQKQESPPAAQHKTDETGDPSTAATGGGRLQVTTMGQNMMKGPPQVKATPPDTSQLKRDERDFNYTKVPGTSDPGVKSMQMPLKKIPPKSDWLGSVREPVTVMQRPQSMNPKQAPVSSMSSSPPIGSNWYPNTTTSGIDTVKPKVVAPATALSRSISPNGVSSNPLYNQFQPQLPFGPGPNHSSGPMDLHMPPLRVNSGGGLWSSRGSGSPSLSAASSLGLFSGIGSSGSSSPVDWSTGSSSLQLDYTSIDWSLDLGTLPTRPNGLWAGGSYPVQGKGPGFDSFAYGMGMKAAAMRPVLASGGGLPEGIAGSGETGSGSSREWTSPFEERDIFSLPRQFVSSPSL